MKNRILLTACMAFLLGVPHSVTAQESLGSHMEALDDAYKAFRRETDPVKGAAAAREAQAAVLKGLSQVPEFVNSLGDPTAKAKADVEYRKMMAMLYVTFCEVEEAFLENDLEKVAQLVQAIRDSKKQGHDKFIEE